MNTLTLLPQPRSINFNSGEHRLGNGRFILLESEEPSKLLFSARALQAALQRYAGTVAPVTAASSGPGELMGIVLRLVPRPNLNEQGYALAITPQRVILEAQTPAGIFYGVNTFIQVLKQRGPVLPCLEITDWPDFPVRGFMLDTSRDKVPTMPSLLELIDKLASWKINQLQLYTEHTFEYLNHPEAWENASPLTGQEILELDTYCKERFIELVPNQNSFGHMHRWLELPRYAGLAELTGSFEAPWGTAQGPFSLDPTNPASLELVTGLFDELLPHFTSGQVNIGCDETFDLGQGKSKAACEQQGKGKVYLDFLLKICNNLIARGYRVQFWGDIILEHPELIPEIPEGVIALNWGYEATHPFELEGARFQAANIPFYVCPGTSAWCSLGGRTANATGNLLKAAESGLKYGASGYLITDWGDLGHWQTLPVSYLGIVTGAALAWSIEANRNLDIPAALDRHAFEDQAGVLGQLAYDLGNIYQLPGLARSNGSQLFWILQTPAEVLNRIFQTSAPVEPLVPPLKLTYIPESTFVEALKQLDRVMAPLEDSRMAGADAELVKREFRLTANMMRLACYRGLLALDGPRYIEEYGDEIAAFIREYEAVWLSRNRPGGLSDSINRFNLLLK